MGFSYYVSLSLFCVKPRVELFLGGSFPRFPGNVNLRSEESMRWVADFHLHSKYSQACSPLMEPISLAEWGVKKGVNLLGTGDFTHPVYLAELKKILEPAEFGLFRVRAHSNQPRLSEVRFMLSSEVALFFKEAGKPRKIHLILIAPSFEIVERLNSLFRPYGKLEEDGRPKLWLSLRDSIRMVREVSDDCWIIPAHIWSPWFSLFGAFSGFNSLEEAFGDQFPQIDAMETGLSSDPLMNGRVSSLDQIPLVSNSDAHSLPKMGREANVLEAEADLRSIRDAIRSNDPGRFLYTIEFYPEEGKYHYDGHRGCGISLSPAESRKMGGKCPVCGKRLTVGVMHRVDDLADRSEKERPGRKIPARYLVPLIEIVAEALGKRVESKGVQVLYRRLIAAGGNEMAILLDIPEEALFTVVPPEIAAGIVRMRQGKVSKVPGYDGVYGKIAVFNDLLTDS
jgi:uncharacterized protein (TIGR00375 family)